MYGADEFLKLKITSSGIFQKVYNYRNDVIIWVIMILK